MYTERIHMVYYSKISVLVQGNSGTIFNQKKSELDLDTPTHFHSILGFWDFFLCKKPLGQVVTNIVGHFDTVWGMHQNKIKVNYVTIDGLNSYDLRNSA